MTSLAFDIYGTLIDPFSLGRMLEDMIGAKAPNFNILWRDKQLEYSFRKAVMKQFNHFSECTKQALHYCNEYFKTNLSEEQMLLLLGSYRKLPPYHETRDCLSNLKDRKFEIMAFSNGKKEDLISLFENGNIESYFDQVISVDEVRTFKPAPEVYQFLAEKASADFENTWMISANSFDVIGAAAVGLKTIWLKRGPDVVFDPFGISPDHIINSLSDLEIGDYF